MLRADATPILGEAGSKLEELELELELECELELELDPEKDRALLTFFPVSVRGTTEPGGRGDARRGVTILSGLASVVAAFGCPEGEAVLGEERATGRARAATGCVNSKAEGPVVERASTIMPVSCCAARREVLSGRGSLPHNFAMALHAPPFWQASHLPSIRSIRAGITPSILH